MKQRPVLARFVKNAGFILGGRLWTILLWFLVTPYVLNQLGAERFGVWSLLFLLSGYLATFDLGLATSVVKYVAGLAAVGDWRRLNQTLSQIMRLYALLGVLGFAIILALHGWMIGILKISPEHYEEVRFALLASAATFAVANLISVGIGTLNGMQRMDTSNTITVMASLPQIAVLVLGLHLGYGLYAVVVAAALYWLLVAIACATSIRRMFPEIRWPSFRSSGEKAEWIGFSVFMQLNNILGLSQQQIDKVLLAIWAGIRTVAEFELGFRVANGLRSLPALMMSPLIPTFSELNSKGDREHLRTLFVRGTAVVSVGAIGMIACVAPAAPLLVRGWVGDGHETAELLAQWLLLGFGINICTGIGTAATRGAGRPDLEALPMVTALAVHLVLSKLWIDAWGPVGVGPAFTVSFLLWAILIFGRVSRWTGGSFLRLLRDALLWPVLSSIPAALLCYAVASSWPLLDGRVGLLLGFAVSVGISGAAYGTFWWARYRKGLLRI